MSGPGPGTERIAGDREPAPPDPVRVGAILAALGLLVSLAIALAFGSADRAGAYVAAFALAAGIAAAALVRLDHRDSLGA